MRERSDRSILITTAPDVQRIVSLARRTHCGVRPRCYQPTSPTLSCLQQPNEDRHLAQRTSPGRTDCEACHNARTNL